MPTEDFSASDMGEEGRVAVHGSPTRYFKAGQGPPLVLVHGLGDAAVVWHRNIGVLASRFTVLAPDIPGHGHSPPPPWSYSLERGTEWLIALLDALGLEQVSLVGGSLGGLLVTSAALKAPERVRRLVLVDSAGLGKEIALLLRFMSLPAVGEAIGRPTMANLRRLMQVLFYDSSAVPNSFLEALHQERLQPGNKAAMLRVLREGVSLLGVKDKVILTERLSGLKVKTLVVWGRADAIFPVAHAYRAREAMPDVSLHIFEACGHWPYMECHAMFNKLVLDFLNTSGH